jgi:hypothetical protein
VVSGAWLLPLADAEAPEDLARLTAQRHHLFHNPQLMLKREGDPHTRDLKRERTELIARLAASLAERRKTERLERREWWRRLHAVRDELHALHPSALEDLDERIAAVRRQAEDNKVLLWREYFFALHTLASLRQFVQTVREGQSQE